VDSGLVFTTHRTYAEGTRKNMTVGGGLHPRNVLRDLYQILDDAKVRESSKPVLKPDPVRASNAGTLELRNSIVTQNYESGGGGVISNTGVLRVDNSEISHNDADAGGTGISNAASGTAFVRNTDVFDNIAGHDGGGDSQQRQLNGGIQHPSPRIGCD
jgi:hypothetical protein